VLKLVLTLNFFCNLLICFILFAAYASFCLTSDGQMLGWGTGACLGRNANEAKILSPERVLDLNGEKVRIFFVYCIYFYKY